MKSLHQIEDTQDATGSLDRLFELGVLLVDAMDGGLAESGMSRARAEVIWRLRRHGPLTQRDLSEGLRCTPRNVTGLVDGLESAGLVTRQPHPADRRAILVTLTDKGEATAGAWHDHYRQLGRYLLGDLPEAEVSSFFATLDHILEALHKLTSASAKA